jgi:hypothetical protein
MKRKRWVGPFARGATLISTAIGATACGAADDEGEQMQEFELSDAQLAARDEKVASSREALGEASCATTPADATLDGASFVQQSAISPLPLYDHPTCRDAFVVDIPAVTAPRTLAVYAGVGSSTNPIACLFSFTVATLFKKQGTEFVKVTDASGVGVIPWPGSSGYTCVCKVDFGTLAPGDYKVAAASAQFLGPKLLVGVFLGAN